MQDHISGNWWLGLGKNVEPVGYWPAAIFTLLSDHATMVSWGGEVMYKNSSGKNTVVQMGSGEYANKGFTRAAYFCNLKIADYNDTLLPVQDFVVRVTHPKHYTKTLCPQRSTAARVTSSMFSLFIVMIIDCIVEHCLNHRFGSEHTCPGPKKPEPSSSISNANTDEVTTYYKFSSSSDIG
ncbi:unnamed protein product [Cochlearia groenlandica]